MAKKLMAWKTKGMNRDLSVSAFNPEFAFENRNLRLGTNDSNTVMSWVNEKGTKKIKLVSGNWKDGDDSSKTSITELIGTPIGTAIINHQLVVFTTDTENQKDYIYVLRYADLQKESMLCKQLFGDMSLGFDINHPIETLTSYEAEDVQKVYWVDGKNQPRVININGKIRLENNTQFDFIPTLQLKENVYVKKLLGANGMFAPGIIQYAFTYYTKYGQESNIFYTSPLLYISYRDRGASPEDKVENAFQITVEDVDKNFDYLRIYSIHRTSINATPFCKRIQDISIASLDGTTAKYIDTGTSGESIDPTELLYKGGESIVADTIEQKDGTLFLGNLSIERDYIDSSLKDTLKESLRIEEKTRLLSAPLVLKGSYTYASQLTAFSEDESRSVPCGGFKRGDVYRLGIQFQYKTGKWSEPIFIKDSEPVQGVDGSPLVDDQNRIVLPVFSSSIDKEIARELLTLGYKKARGLVVFPSLRDRNILCQGVVNPTLYTDKHVTDGDLYAQSSWFFRTSKKEGGTDVADDKSVSPVRPENGGFLNYTSRELTYNPILPNIRSVEIQGEFSEDNKFRLSSDVMTFHSPDIEFDDQLSLIDYSQSSIQQIGYVNFLSTFSDIDIQTETPTISNLGSGFVHKSFTRTEGFGTFGIVSGLFYDDTVVEDWGKKNEEPNVITPFESMFSSAKWIVYLWNKSGSLNNDINRPSDKGTQTAILKKKIISNLRYSKTVYEGLQAFKPKALQLYASDELGIVKLDDSHIYRGNIDTVLIPDDTDGQYFTAGSPIDIRTKLQAPFKSDCWWKTFAISRNHPKKVKTIYGEVEVETAETGEEDYGLYYWDGPSKSWVRDTYEESKSIGNQYIDIVLKKEGVRMKYKSTPHLVISSNQGDVEWYNGEQNKLPVVEVTQEVAEGTRYGGASPDALQENIWLPCGEPVVLEEDKNTDIRWEYGDTYFQRWDCLKTYAFTREDPNQVVEIGSFMLETRVNIDGRYDRNRGQLSNLNMSPLNFNLINPVYSQVDNFFQYRIMDDAYYTNTKFPNQITWSKTKENGANVDLWTNVTLASILEMDGNKGEVTSLQRLNNQLVCFQNTGIAQILYNDNVQVSSTNGVPIEIANSGKVAGKDYKSDTVGCANKWSIEAGVNGLYFMDSEGKNLYLFNGQLTNLSTQGGFNSWSKVNIPSSEVKWIPQFKEGSSETAFRTFHDKLNQEMLFINKETCLAFSEKFSVFTSFYDYNAIPFFCNLDDTGLWLNSDASLWKHQAGEYCNFFEKNYPYSMILVGNPEPQTDKIFTNLEFRACVSGEGTSGGESTFDKTFDYTFHLGGGKYTPFLPFDGLETWDEYQHGYTSLENMSGHRMFQHHTLNDESSLKRKFRIWRCDIPRDNMPVSSEDKKRGIFRIKKRPTDRMRNPWLYLKLSKSAAKSQQFLGKTEVHDLIMTYFN